jgi:hypothetical protein
MVWLFEPGTAILPLREDRSELTIMRSFYKKVIRSGAGSLFPVRFGVRQTNPAQFMTFISFCFYGSAASGTFLFRDKRLIPFTAFFIYFVTM